MVQQVLEEETVVQANAADPWQRSGGEGGALSRLERNQSEADERSRRLLLLTIGSTYASWLMIN